MPERHASVPEPLRSIVNAACPSNHWNDGNDVCADCGEDLNPPAEEPAAAPFWTVAIYLIDRYYGGPEEGGWFYTGGDRIDHELDGVSKQCLLMVFTEEEAANKACTDLNVALDKTINVGRRDIGSMLSQGRYTAEVYNGHPPKHFPETRPHYE